MYELSGLKLDPFTNAVRITVSGLRKRLGEPWLIGTLLLAVVLVFLLRYVPDTAIATTSTFVPNRSELLRAFVPPTLIALIALLVGGVLGGWLLAGRMLSPLARITEATRVAGTGALSHRIHMDDRKDEFGELADAFDGMLAKLELHVSEKHGVFLTIDGSSADVVGSSPLLLQMITNLVHNAIVHNLPQGGQVRVSTFRERTRAIVVVENTGADLAAVQVSRLTEPFLKAAGRTRLDDQPGNGLGLSIVEKITRAHHGVLHLAPRHGGGVIARA